MDLGGASTDLDGLNVSVASLLDLVRLAEASTSSDDHARVPALRRTLELADSPPAATSGPPP